LIVASNQTDKHSSLAELSLSYNGGKDCLVLLILYLAALHAHSVKTATPLPNKLQSVYIVSSHPFTEVEDFVQLSIDTYHLDLARYAESMRQAFENYLHDNSHVKAIFVGTRRTDPHGADLKHFDPTDRGWPAFMRIHPVIDWHYADVWTVSSSPVDRREEFPLIAIIVYTTPEHTLLLAL
jgi:FAD synthetase